MTGIFAQGLSAIVEFVPEIHAFVPDAGRPADGYVRLRRGQEYLALCSTFMAWRAFSIPDTQFMRSTPKPIAARTLFLMSAAYWAYVTLSDVLYAYNMQVDITILTHIVFFAPWSVRVVQHLLLFPLLLACFWTSSRVGWSWTRGLPVQVLLGVVFSALAFPALQGTLKFFVTVVWGPAPMTDQPEESFWALWTATFVNFLLTYAFGVALVSGFTLYQRYRDSEVRGAALEQGWATARLSALRMQLSPHTLFNLLHTIRGQIHPEPEIARSMVVQLADLLRRLLSAGQRDFSLLSEELTFARLYLQLQQQRFADRLTVTLPEAAKQPALWVPSLILQPLVENAVLHGLAGHDEWVTIRIVVIVSAETLTLRIENTFGGSGPVNAEGIGLSNVRERLAVQFGAEATFHAGAADERLWVAEITMPALRELSSGRTVGPQGAS
jgi:hypothetical protein